MPSHQAYSANLSTRGDSSALTTSYGTNSAGWTTKGLDVSDYEYITVEYTYGGYSATATTLSMKPMISDTGAADLDSYRNTETPDSNGALAVDELTFAITADKVGTFQLDVRGVSKLRIAAKVGDATDSPTLAMRYVGFSLSPYRPLPHIAPQIVE